MIHLNLRPDLETALREMSAKSGYPLTTICVALMHLGLKAGVKRINDSCAMHARPMGRPIDGVPVLATPKMPAPSTKDEVERRKRMVDELYAADRRGKAPQED